MPTACLECGLELEYDFAACPRCGWQPPAAWSLDEVEEEPERFKRSAVMKKNRLWLRVGWVLVFLIFLWRFYHYMTGS